MSDTQMITDFVKDVTQRHPTACKLIEEVAKIKATSNDAHTTRAKLTKICNSLDLPALYDLANLMYDGDNVNVIFYKHYTDAMREVLAWSE